MDKLAEGVDALAQSAGTLNATTLPRLNRMSDDATRAVRQLGRTAGNLSDNPQSLMYGNGPRRARPRRARLHRAGRRPLRRHS